MWTDNPVADFERFDAAENRRIERFPRCMECGEHIQTETAYYIEGWICEDCLDILYKRYVEVST